MVEDEARESQRVERLDPPLLAWKMEEGAMSQARYSSSLEMLAGALSCQPMRKRHPWPYSHRKLNFASDVRELQADSSPQLLERNPANTSVLA